MSEPSNIVQRVISNHEYFRGIELMGFVMVIDPEDIYSEPEDDAIVNPSNTPEESVAESDDAHPITPSDPTSPSREGSPDPSEEYVMDSSNNHSEEVGMCHRQQTVSNGGGEVPEVRDYRIPGEFVRSPSVQDTHITTRRPGSTSGLALMSQTRITSDTEETIGAVSDVDFVSTETDDQEAPHALIYRGRIYRLQEEEE